MAAKTYFGYALADAMFSGDCLIRRKCLSLEAAKALVEKGVTSCLNRSHIATIHAMENRFGIYVEIPPEPPQMVLETGDRILVMGVRGLPRLTDRHEYTTEEIARADFAFHLYEVLKTGEVSAEDQEP